MPKDKALPKPSPPPLTLADLAGLPAGLDASRVVVVVLSPDYVPPPAILTSEQAADRLGLSYGSFRILANRPGFPTVYLPGGTPRYVIADVVDYMRRTAPPVGFRKSGRPRKPRPDLVVEAAVGAALGLGTATPASGFNPFLKKP